jgi:hypothetical protein
MSDAIGYYGEGGQSASQSAYWQNLYDQRAEWGPTDFDAAHMFALSHVWDIPVGKGRPFLTSMHPVLNGIIGNRQLSGILTLRRRIRQRRDRHREWSGIEDLRYLYPEGIPDLGAASNGVSCRVLQPDQHADLQFAHSVGYFGDIR